MFDIKPTDVFGNVNGARIKNLQRIITLERKKTAADLRRLHDALQINPVSRHRAEKEGVFEARIPAVVPKLKPQPSLHRQALQDSPSAQHSRLDAENRKSRMMSLEGHNFLPSREELMREIEIIEERDRKLALFSRLTHELEHDLEKKPPPLSQKQQYAHREKKSSSVPIFEKLAELSRQALFFFRPPSLWPQSVRVLASIFLASFFFGSLTYLVAGYYSKTAGSARSEGLAAYGRLMRGVDAALRRDFVQAGGDFSVAHKSLKSIGGLSRMAASGLVAISDALSLSSQTSSGVHVLDAAERFAKAGEDIAAYAALFSKNGVGSLTPKEFITGYMGASDLRHAKKLLADVILNLEEAADSLAKTDVEKLPEEFQKSVGMLRDKIPGALLLARQFASFQDSLFDVFGYMGPRKYLVVFQNSAEQRPTGGFIGSYALLDVLDGKITRIFIDDVFNIDGQLVEKIVPPFPIQKISTAWSLHDANWFFDYPTSAKKIAWFYERTGGASLDGVFAVTPAFLQNVLELTGPLMLPGYDLALTQDNFQDELSYLVEEGSLKKEGESPKVVLRDLGTLILDQLQAQWKSGETLIFFNMLSRALEKRDLTLWVKEPSIEEFLARRQWGGSVRVSDGDYLAVVHANINGYKTDRVITQEIFHDAHILQDGSVVDTLTITRTHHGSPTPRYLELYQKVNADYLRIFVPKGSTLLGAEGHTLQEHISPINYAEANFAQDPEVRELELSLRIDEESGTHIYDEAGKTVFANWVYVSPGETVTVRYTYKLPWSIKRGEGGKYVMLAQKQAGEGPTVFSGSVHIDGAAFIAEGDIPQSVPFEKDIEYIADIR